MDGVIQNMDNMNQMEKDLPPLSQAVSQAVYCQLEARVRRSSSLRVACAGREHCRPDYLIRRADYVCHGLELVVQGKGELCMKGKTYQLRPGHIFLYGPSIAHEIRCDPAAPMIKYFVDFFGGSGEKLYAHGMIQPGGVRLVHELEAMVLLFDELLREGKKASPLRVEICAQYASLLLLKSGEAGEADSRMRAQSLINFQRCRIYVEEHAKTLSGLQALASAVHLDPRYICRLFKRHHYLSPHRYIIARRMSRASELLSTTEWTVKTVAMEVGYDDPLHFSRVFARYFRCAPSEFRKYGNTRQVAV
jgi:AraC family transcriptional regulator of arabinose operon